MDYSLHHKRRLPHYQPNRGIFFITFRLDFPIPSEHVTALSHYREVLNASLERNRDNSALIDDNSKRLFAYIDDSYNHLESEISLISPNTIAQVLRELLLSFRDELYYLYAFTIMPNHVHILLKPNIINGGSVPVANIIRRIKGASARKINLILRREGTLWFREYYDRCARNQQELINIVEYIRQNPVKAKLVNTPELWEWTWINPDLYNGHY